MRPEHEKALQYLERKGTRLDRQEIYERIRGTFSSTEEFLDTLAPEEARHRPAPEAWTVHEVIDHLVESHRPGVEELRSLLRGERPADGPIPASLHSHAPMDRPWSELVTELKQLHRAFLQLLDTVPDDFTTEARAPAVLVVPVKSDDGREAPLEWVEDLDWKAYAVTIRVHELDHLHQAKAALKAASREA